MSATIICIVSSVNSCNFEFVYFLWIKKSQTILCLSCFSMLSLCMTIVNQLDLICVTNDFLMSVPFLSKSSFITGKAFIIQTEGLQIEYALMISYSWSCSVNVVVDNEYFNNRLQQLKLILTCAHISNTGNLDFCVK